MVCTGTTGSLMLPTRTLELKCKASWDPAHSSNIQVIENKTSAHNQANVTVSHYQPYKRDLNRLFRIHVRLEVTLPVVKITPLRAAIMVRRCRVNGLQAKSRFFCTLLDKKQTMESMFKLKSTSLHVSELFILHVVASIGLILMKYNLAFF